MFACRAYVTCDVCAWVHGSEGELAMSRASRERHDRLSSVEATLAGRGGGFRRDANIVSAVLLW